MSRDGFHIRAGDAADLEAVLAIERGSEGAPQWSESVWRGILERATGSGPLREFFVAFAAECVAGFVVVTVSGGVAEIESVAVAAKLRRRGVGAALCRHAMLWAAGRRASQIELEVRSKAEGARALYAGLGFVEQGVRPGYYHRPEDDAVLLTFALDDGWATTANNRAKV